MKRKINQMFSLWNFSFLIELTNNESETKAKINPQSQARPQKIIKKGF